MTIPHSIHIGKNDKMMRDNAGGRRKCPFPRRRVPHSALPSRQPVLPHLITEPDELCMD